MNDSVFPKILSVELAEQELHAAVSTGDIMQVRRAQEAVRTARAAVAEASRVVRAEEQARAGYDDPNAAADLAQIARAIGRGLWLLAKVLVIGLFIIFVAVWFVLSRPAAFDENAIASIKNDIRATYKRKDFVVHDLILVKESGRKLSGYISLSSSNSISKITLNCSATMGEDGQSFWQCNP